MGKFSTTRTMPDNIKKQLQKSIKDVEYIAFDLETTGGNPEKNGITEIFGLRYINGVVQDSFHQLVNPQRTIPPIVRKITGITNEMVKDAPKIDQVMPHFIEFIKDGILVSHNVISDMRFLEFYAQKICQIEIKNLYLCTHLLGRKLFPDSPEKSLKGFAQFLKIEHGELHRAEEDAKCTYQLLSKIQTELTKENILSIEHVLRYQRENEILIRIGWGISNQELFNLQSKPGILRFFDFQGKEIYITSAINLKKTAFKLKVLRKLSKHLLKKVLQVQSFSYSIFPDYYSSLIEETKESVKTKPIKQANKKEFANFNSISIKKIDNQIEVQIGPVAAHSTQVLGPVKDYKKCSLILKEFVKFTDGHSKKNIYYLPSSYENILVLYLKKKILKSFWANIKLNFVSHQLFEKIKFFLNLPKMQNFEKLYLANEHYGVIQIPLTETKSWAFYPVVKGLSLEAHIAKSPWKLWKKTAEGKLFSQKIKNNKKNAEAKSLSIESAALLNANLWFIHSKKLRQKHSLGEYFPL